MNVQLVGRKKEQDVLKKALQTSEAEMIAIIGRRRVGKTFLIRTVYKKYLSFDITGIQNAPRKEQLQNFSYQLTDYMGSIVPIKTPKNWLEAFRLLILFLKQKKTKKKKVVFLDELPWLATHKSGFLRALGYFWNSWAVQQNIVVVICGSAASWMIQKVINHKGGLHNRITKRIDLQPFTLLETKQYLQSRHIHFNHYQILQLYMAMGGIPHYLKEIEGSQSAIQNINSICFSTTGLLNNEFERLYPALFEHAEKYIMVIKALAKKRQGITRNELVTISEQTNGGHLSRILQELIQAGFIMEFFPFDKKKKDKLYRLTDEYSLFYLRFIAGQKPKQEDSWQQLSQTQTYKIWCGYAFENICLKHIPQIKKALGITGIYSSTSSFYKKGNQTEKGTQIDLLIDRNDQTINLIEIKFYGIPFTVTKAYAKNLQEKKFIFQATTKTRKQVFITLLTTFGVLPNQHSLGLINQALTIDDLFES